MTLVVRAPSRSCSLPGLLWLNFSKSLPEFSRFAILPDTVCLYRGVICFQHVKPHVLRPWNELADSISTFFKDPCGTPQGVGYSPITGGSLDAFDAYIAPSTSNAQDQLACTHYSDSCRNAIYALDVSIVASKLDKPLCDKPSVFYESVSILCVQLNVQTLVQERERKSLCELLTCSGAF